MGILFQKSCNMYLESLHKILKYYQLQGNKNKRLDICIDALLRLIRDHYFQTLHKLCKNMPSKNEDAVLRNYSKAVSGEVRETTQIIDDLRFVTSSTNYKITYEVRKVMDDKGDCS